MRAISGGNSFVDKIKLETTLKELHSFLNLNQKIWKREVIQNYPDYIDPYGEALINSLLKMTDDELYPFSLLDKLKYVSEYLPENLKHFDSIVSNVSTLVSSFFRNDKIESPLNLPQQVFLNLKGKKRHEFFELATLLERLKLLPSADPIIDFCGGAGYFARNLAYYFSTETISIDIDSDLQFRGKEKNVKYIPSGAKSFELHTVDLLSSPNKFLEIAKPNSPFIGIHACGHLLDRMLSLATSLNSKWLLGIGCCYYKTTNYQYSLSQLNKETPLETTPESLVCASRGHDVSIDSFKFSLKVKRHRYLLHIFLKDLLEFDFMPVGQCDRKLYEGDFLNYALNRLTEIFDSNFANSKIIQLKELEKQQAAKVKVEKMLRCNFIRVHFGKLIEYAIALDRALFLIESGYDVSIFELFDPNISPRNLAILGVKK